MNNQEFIRAIIFSAPLICTLVCLILTILNTGRSKNPVHRKLHYRFIVSYGVLMLAWLGFVLHSVAHPAFIHYIPLFIPLVLFGSVLNYRTIYMMADTGERGRKFSDSHFIAPAIMSFMLMVAALMTSNGKLNQIVYAPGGSAVRIVAIGMYFIVIVIGYRIMALAEIWKYMRKTAGTAKDDHRKSLNRSFWLIATETVVLPLPACGLLLGMEIFVNAGYLWIVAVLPTLPVCIISCYNLLSEQYVIVEAEPEKEQEAEDNVLRLSRQRVEGYLDNKKPWLNPAFRITDMAEDLYTNRAYISSFINKEYKMNFSRFINEYRLREVERLREEAAQRKRRISSMQIVLNAGFSNYRNYLRAKAVASDPNS